MKIIKKLAHQIHEEAEGAADYAKCAVHYREEYPDLSRLYAEMAEQELTHATKMHEFVVKLIARVRETAEPPKYMLDLWEEEHKEIIEEVAQTKAMIAMIQR